MSVPHRRLVQHAERRIVLNQVPILISRSAARKPVKLGRAQARRRDEPAGAMRGQRGVKPLRRRFVVLDGDRAGYVLDEHGIAQGGIRTPWVDVPTAVMGGLGQSGESFAMLFGRTEPFDDATLSTLYPGGKDEYLERFGAALDATIAAGFLLEEDRLEILAVAAHSYPLRLADG